MKVITELCPSLLLNIFLFQQLTWEQSFSLGLAGTSLTTLVIDCTDQEQNDEPCQVPKLVFKEYEKVQVLLTYSYF